MPTAQLSAEDDNGTDMVCIVLASPGYWPKMYVESAYSKYYGSSTNYFTGWTWTDAAATGTGNKLVTLTYNNKFGNVQATGTLSVSGTATIYSWLYPNNGISIPDSKKILLGNQSDLQIYHNSADSFISDVGTGNLVISGSGVWIKNAAINSNMIGCVEGSGGYVKLYQNGNEKLATASAGVSVTGNLSVSGNGVLKQIVSNAYATADLNNWYTGSTATLGQFYRYDSTHGHFQDAAGNVASNAPNTLTQSPTQIYSYGALLTLGTTNSFRGQFYMAHSASEIYWRSGWGTSSDQNWTRLVGDRNIQSVINNVGNISIGGAPSAAGKLTIHTGTNTNGLLIYEDTDDSITHNLYIDSSDQGVMQLRNNSNTSTVQLHSGGHSFFTGGSLGVGTSSPSYKLHVTGGDVKLTSYSNSVYIGSTRLLGYDSSTAGNLWVIGGSGGASGSCRVTLGTGWNWDTSCDFHYAPGTAGAGNGILTIGQQSKNNANYSHGHTRFFINGSEQLRIKENAVGIGTTAPDNPLEVVGADSGIKISSTSSNRPHLRLECGTAEKLRLSANTLYGAIGDSSDTNRYMVLKDGRIGVGLVSPSAKLHIAGSQLGQTLNDYQTHFHIQSSLAGNTGHLQIKDVRTSAGSSWPTSCRRLQMKIDSTYMGYIQWNGTGNNYGMSFGTGSTTSHPGNVTEAMRIDSSQRVGIGTTGPSARLHVKDSVDNSYKSGLAIERSADGAKTYINTRGGATTFNNHNHAESAGLPYHWFMDESHKMTLIPRD